jgi:hypothetical protein
MSDVDNTQAPKVTIDDYINRSLVVAFCSEYLPSDIRTADGEVFNEIRLRKYFHAYTISLGDPLVIYIQSLEKNGFTMRTDITGQPVIFVKRKVSAHERNLIDDVFSQE